jgi:serine/threonine protein kinase
MGEADHSLRCPISLELFNDPVMGNDGHTYERKNITTWLQTHQTSPVTREPMHVSSLRPNHLVRKLVDEFIATSKEKQYRFRLDIDIRQCEQLPDYILFGKIIYKAKWLEKQGPPIILVKLVGARACQEASFYAELSCHPHIVRTFGLIYSDPTSTLLVQEFTPYNNLSYQLREQEFRPSAEVFLEIFAQIIDALLCLVDNGIVHGNVACRSVLAFRLHPTKPKHNLFKLTDFGLTKASTVFSEVADATDTIFTFKPIRFCAPEILRKKNSV